MCNISNALFRSKTLEWGIHLLDDQDALGWLREHCDVDNGMDLFKCAYDGWRFCLPHSIATDYNGTLVLPRNPTVLMEDDPNWFTGNTLHQKVRMLAEAIPKQSGRGQGMTAE